MTSVAPAPAPAPAPAARRAVPPPPPAWAPVVGATAAATAERLALAEGPEGLSPPPALVWEALRFAPPEGVRVVVVGQDPYPDPADACGLSFATPPGRPLPPSLRSVGAALARQGLLGGGAEGAALPDGDLRAWAAQGVLLLNAAPTTRAGASRAHAAEWRGFAGAFLGRLAARRAAAGCPPAVLLLWGGDARALRPAAEAAPGGAGAPGGAFRVLEWTHPSPLADNRLPPGERFRECPHFAEANAALASWGVPPVAWDPWAPVLAFTDGACEGNGGARPRAAFGAALAGGCLARARVWGQVAPAEYALVAAAAAAAADGAGPGAPLPLPLPDEAPLPDGALAALDVRPAPGSERVAPSNNRGELLGVIHALLALLKGHARGAVEIFSDSEITVRTLLEWLPGRLAKGTERGLKNFDLVWIAWRLLEALRGRAASVALTWVRAHQPRPPPEAGARALALWRGNALADALAERAQAAPLGDRGEAGAPPARWAEGLPPGLAWALGPPPL